VKFINKFFLIVPLVVLFLTLVLSCTDIVVDTISWEDDGSGYIQYSTNNGNLFNTGHLKSYISTYEGTYDTTTFFLKKVSGSRAAGYGVVVCYQDDDNYYRILINGYGRYHISRMFGGVYNTLTTWTDSADILKGNNAINKIGVVRDDPTNIFTVAINDGLNINFTDSNLTSGSSGSNDTRFKITAPVAVP